MALSALSRQNAVFSPRHQSPLQWFSVVANVRKNINKVRFQKKMPEDEYSHVSKGKLKLKTDGEIKKKKKKKKDKEKLQTAAAEVVNAGSASGSTQRVLTKAELSFKQMQEKTQNKRILEKASMTHKERVEKFNQHLDGLTEHFDIPKVSWTK